MEILKKIFGDPNARVIRELQATVERINALEPEIKKLSDADLRGKTAEFRVRLEGGEPLDDLLPEAFAAAREAAWRTLGQRHYDVQLMGGLVLHRGNIAEMRTGEGKTLTATLAVYANALAGKGVHVVTVNDYLGRRDAVWMGQVYHALGLSVGTIQHETAYLYDPDYKVSEEKKEEGTGIHEGSPEDRRRDTTGAFRVEYAFLRPVTRKEAYAADITYGTNNEFGFDYLRDNMAPSMEDTVMRELHYAVVDEVDSILIDEARTPLIISAPAEESTDLYYRFADLVRSLDAAADYEVDEKMHAATFTMAGQEKVAKILGEDPWATTNISFVHHLEQALKAETLYKRDRNYVVREGEVVIVDEFTGRLMFGRRYSEGLHQAIEAKEGAKIQRESRTMATITFQNLFRLYAKLAGMTGTAATEAEEFGKIYKLDVVTVPTAKPMVRRDQPDRVYKNEVGKFAAVAAEIKELHGRGQPVLVGTISIDKNERLSELLTREGIPHALLNAKNHEKEAEIIAQAGRKGAVTVATNMAGRGVDIILGGNPPDSEMSAEVRALGGLHVLGTERHESRRIDNQLRGRSGRQGDPGSSRFYVSLEDDLMRIFASPRIKTLMERLGLPEDMPIENRMVSKSLETAQHKVEGHNFDIRKHLLEYDDVLNRHRTVIYKQRREILEIASGAREGSNRDRILEMVEGEIDHLVAFYTSTEKGAVWDVREIAKVAGTIFPVPPNLAEEFEAYTKGETAYAEAEVRTKIIDRLIELARAAYSEVEKRIVDPDLMKKIEAALTLRAIDMLWVEHLEAMEHLRTGIGLRGYGQMDPLVEYKRDSFRMFQELQALIQKQVVTSIFRVGVAAQTAARVMPRNIQLQAPAKESGGGGAAGKSADKVGRNDPCPCGSGKKYKKCHGA
ncbi:preprotein translocase subunit SecA [Candidatus Uhrbacteria bacterium RIFCSPHIGHO2_12_FULL_57_11]|uniref:Protein translocase subunit SecA n=2 Tax=Candidatus Uhriibacteriota TaxID=1752732 RepID=A0A1F7UL59_9BACT|nr:MAG: preprotein translocase subunit SecA [Candidatus Uhrbacteria bacterium RIFCSPHIGHO2_02_FULL_57_19]OGL78985.1 MAG: preprotein translocase subunit SecA [Candidatus Uhrbacteria bacterium RIFCSPHIGHO2_12_FULL_57_11]